MQNSFGINIIPENENERQAALKRYLIADTNAEPSFDNITKLATKIFKVPISLISIVDVNTVYFKSNTGMGVENTSERGDSLCALSVLDPEVTVFEDALKNACLLSNPNVAGNFGLRFYAGAPLITHDGYLIGTICIIDKQPRTFSDSEKEILQSLAVSVMDQMECRLSSMKQVDK